MTAMAAPYGIRYLNGHVSPSKVGYGARTIVDTNKFDAYWPIDQLKGTHHELVAKGKKIATGRFTDVTVDHMVDIIRNTLPQTRAIAAYLERSTLEATLISIFQYFLRYYQYTEDNPSFEELRNPLRAYADRKAGIDCDCFTISISSILTNLKIPHAIRRAQYEPGSDFSHVYIVVPKFKGASLSTRSNYYVVDPVIHKFDFEYPQNDTPMKKADTPVKFGLNGLFGFSEDCESMLNGLGLSFDYSSISENGGVIVSPIRENLLSISTPKPVEEYKSDSEQVSLVKDEPTKTTLTEPAEKESFIDKLLNPVTKVLDKAVETTNKVIEVKNDVSSGGTVVSSKTTTPNIPKELGASLLGDNPMRTILMVGALGALAYVAFNDGPDQPKPGTRKPSARKPTSRKRSTTNKKLSGPKGSAKKSGKVPASKHQTIKI